MKVDLFMSTDRVRTSRRAGYYERTFGWEKLAGGGVRCHVLRGDHASILSPGSLKKMSPVIRKCMDRSGRGGDGHGR